MKIAICGKMGSGKSYIADGLYKSCLKKNNPEQNYYVYSFAEKVKILSKELFNKKYKDRECLIKLATKMREIVPDVWLNYTLNTIKNANKENIVIDDLRLTNEYERLVKDKWIIIKIEIDEEIRMKRLKNKYNDDFENHIKYINSITENDVCCYPDNKFDFVIRNSIDPIADLVTFIINLKIIN